VTLDGGTRTDDFDWDTWPVRDYLAENYLELHAADAAVIDHHSALYRDIAPDGVHRGLEFGAGPNLYPLMLAAAACRRIDAVERSAANVAYTRGQLADGPDPAWNPFYERCRAANPALPPSLTDALSRVRVHHGDAREVTPGRYGLASMNFVAESVTADEAEFTAICRAFVHSVHPGGHLVAAFMENMGHYRIADGPRWPGFPVDSRMVRDVFGPYTVGLRVERIDPDPELPAWGYSGMVLLRARRSG
jgi:hypothetical protein